MIKGIRFRGKIYGYLIRCLGKKKKIMPVYILLLLFAAAAELLAPQLYNVFIDRILINGDTWLFGSVAAGYCALFAVGCAASVMGRILLNELGNTLEYGLRLQALHAGMNPGKENVSAKNIGDVKLKMDHDIGKLSECLQEQFGKFEMQIVLVVFSAVCLLWLNRQLALLGIIAIPITIGIDYQISRREKLLNESNRQNDSDMSSWLYSVVKGWRQIRMFGQEKNQARKYVRFQHKYALYNAKWINYWVTRVLIIPKLKDEFLMEFGVCFAGGILILKGAMSIGDLLVFIVYYHLLTASMTALSAYQASLAADMPVYLRAMSWDMDTAEAEGKEAVSNIREIKLEKISFGYSAQNPDLLENINGVFKKGDCVHIKGKSGSGKTTLVKLMLGLERARGGKISVNGRELETVDLAGYYDNVSGSLQGTYLFHASIRENLLYVKPDATEEELEAACQKAQILDDILAMPEQFDTVAGDRGSRFSGGQCQRLLLARAFLKDADLYFFDEVTSALDKRTAVSVLKEIQNLSKEKIVFLISHDDTAEAICNKLLV